jgi:hypothetical protein
MTNPPTPATSFVIAHADPSEQLVWAKPDSTWCWTLLAMLDGRMLLVTRLWQRYCATPATAATIILVEFGDFPLMRKMMLGIRRRAENAATARTVPPRFLTAAAKGPQRDERRVQHCAPEEIVQAWVSHAAR